MRDLIDIEFDIDTAEDLMREAETEEDRTECYRWRQDLKHELMVTVYRLNRKDF